MKIVPGEEHNFSEKVFKTDKWGNWNTCRGLEKIQNLAIGGGDDYSILKST